MPLLLHFFPPACLQRY